MNGLSKKEVLERQQKFGKNEITRKKKKTKLQVALDIIKDPIIIIMIIAAAISFITGMSEQHFTEFFVILALVLFNIIISFVQEVKTIQKLESLDKMNEGKAIVIRDGEEQLINATELVVDDIVKLKIGAIARADLIILSENNLYVDESFLTGESIDVSKSVNEDIYSNSMIKNGEAVAKVTEIGMNTKIGTIANSVDNVTVSKSQLELKLLDISKILLKIAITFAILIFILSMLNGMSFDKSLSMTISILIATVPEGLATVLTIVLTLMSQHMAKNNALIKKVSLLETLGEVSYICSDKTGTITENNMKVTHILEVIQNNTINSLIKIAIDQDTPTSKAISEYMSPIDVNTTGKVLNRIPFNSTTKFSKTLIFFEDKYYLVKIGAPDYLVDNIEEKHKEFTEYASLGLRTIAVAITEVNPNFDIEKDITCDLTTLFGISDPPKESAIKAIEELKNAHINVVMITGDNINTALSIASQAGIFDQKTDKYLTGSQLDTLNDLEFLNIVEQVRVYARVTPEHKHRIVSALQQKGEIVGMTGDGTNDSIALKQANVGIAMGINGTDISKESADLILLDDNFQTINVAVQSGRLIFDNLKKFIRQMLTSNTAHTASILFSLLFGVFLINSNLIIPMTPVLILWVNIVSDAIPCLALGVDNPENNLMAKKPINPNEKILNKNLIFEILLRGMLIGLLVFVSFNLVYSYTNDEIFARTIGFVILSFGQLVHIFDARSFNTIYKKNPFENKMLLIAVFISSLLNLLIIYSPLNEVFGLTTLPLPILILSIFAAGSLTFIISALKLLIIKLK